MIEIGSRVEPWIVDKELSSLSNLITFLQDMRRDEEIKRSRDGEIKRWRDQEMER